MSENLRTGTYPLAKIDQAMQDAEATVRAGKPLLDFTNV